MEVLKIFNNEINNIIKLMINNGELIKPPSTKGYFKLKDTNIKGSLAMYEAGKYILQNKISKELYELTEKICLKYGFIRGSTLSILTTNKTFLDIRHRRVIYDIFADYVDEMKIRNQRLMTHILKKYYYLKFNGKF